MRVTNYEVLLNEDRIPHLVKESARKIFSQKKSFG